MAHYEIQFSELSHFALGLVSTEVERAKRFGEGLRPKIRLGVRPLQLCTYQEVVGTTMILEKETKNVRQYKEGSKQKKTRYSDTRHD